MEIYKQIKEFNELYEVSDLGNVRSKAMWRGSNEPRVLAAALNSDGYPIVSLCRDGKRRIVSVHMLMAETFLNHENKRGFHVDHINNVRHDNRLSNLQILTHRENSSKRKKSYTSKYVGVSWRKDRGKWTARQVQNGKYKSLGCFSSEIEAHNAYQEELTKFNTI